MKLANIVFLGCIASCLMATSPALAQEPVAPAKGIQAAGIQGSGIRAAGIQASGIQAGGMMDSGSRFDGTKYDRSWRVARARFEAEQYTLRMEYYKWINFNPSRPNVNSTMMITPAHPIYFHASYGWPRSQYGF
jgi:hypothetical protein